MDWIINNVSIVLGLIVVAIFATYSIVSFVVMPKAQKIEDVKEWLKYAVTEAEKMFGSKTGQLKLRFVYDLFLQRYPDIAKYITFEDIQVWVADALIWLNNQIESNQAVKHYIEEK